MGKSSISMGHLYHGYVSHNQRVTGLSPVYLNGFEVGEAPSSTSQLAPASRGFSPPPGR